MRFIEGNPDKNASVLQHGKNPVMQRFYVAAKAKTQIKEDQMHLKYGSNLKKIWRQNSTYVQTRTKHLISIKYVLPSINKNGSKIES